MCNNARKMGAFISCDIVLYVILWEAFLRTANDNPQCLAKVVLTVMISCMSGGPKFGFTN